MPDLRAIHTRMGLAMLSVFPALARSGLGVFFRA